MSYILCSIFFFFKQKTAYEMRISDWSSDVCSSDLEDAGTFKFNPPVQTGPYVLQEASATQLYYVWEKNPDYWNKAELDPAPQYAIWRQATEVDSIDRKSVV